MLSIWTKQALYPPSHLLSQHHHIFWGRISLWTWTHWASKTGWPATFRDPPILTFAVLRLQFNGFLHWSWGYKPRSSCLNGEYFANRAIFQLPVSFRHRRSFMRMFDSERELHITEGLHTSEQHFPNSKHLGSCSNQFLTQVHLGRPGVQHSKAVSGDGTWI